MQICQSPTCPALVAHGYCKRCAAQRERARSNVALRRLYRTARWSRLAEQVKQEEPLCPECAAEGFVTATQDVHHREKATPENFFNRRILQALCHAHHSAHTKRGE